MCLSVVALPRMRWRGGSPFGLLRVDFQEKLLLRHCLGDALRTKDAFEVIELGGRPSDYPLQLGMRVVARRAPAGAER
jgi:hypothetical protein